QASSAVSGLHTSRMAILAPSFAMVRAMERPIPAAPPVTTATLFSSIICTIPSFLNLYFQDFHNSLQAVGVLYIVNSHTLQGFLYQPGQGLARAALNKGVKAVSVELFQNGLPLHRMIHLSGDSSPDTFCILGIQFCAGVGIHRDTSLLHIHRFQLLCQSGS